MCGNPKMDQTRGKPKRAVDAVTLSHVCIMKPWVVMVWRDCKLTNLAVAKWVEDGCSSEDHRRRYKTEKVNADGTPGGGWNRNLWVGLGQWTTHWMGPAACKVATFHGCMRDHKGTW